MTSTKYTCGDCFGFALANAKARDKVVHGLVQDPWTKKRFWHAWIEKPSGKVLDWQSSQGLGPGRRGWTKTTFMNAYAPRRVRVFSPADAKACALKTRHAGPWSRKACPR